MASSFGERLKSARVMAGFSMDALVAKMNHLVSKQAISKYENGLMSPDSSILIAMSHALGVKIDYFFPSYEVSIGDINFRKKAALGKRSLDTLQARIKDNVERYAELESFFPEILAFFNPLEGYLISEPADIDRAAVKLREAWGIGLGAPISYLIDLLEEKGVRVLEIDEEDGFDGLSGWVDSRPFIVLNSLSPADRKRLTALHEYAHLSLKFDSIFSDGEKERLCHSFGSAFLLPYDALIKEIGEKRSHISFYELINIKKQYGISMQAIMFRARAYGIISEHIYEAFSREISARGFRKNEPEKYPIGEYPTRFNQLLHRAISEELVSISKAAYLANKSIEEIRSERLPADASAHS